MLWNHLSRSDRRRRFDRGSPQPSLQLGLGFFVDSIQSLARETARSKQRQRQSRCGLVAARCSKGALIVASLRLLRRSAVDVARRSRYTSKRMKTAVHRPGRLQRWLIFTATACLQLHLLLVVTLHHHELRTLADSCTSVSAGHTHWQNPQAASTQCDACQIARHGITEPTGLAVAFRLPELRRGILLCTACSVWANVSTLPARAPPVLS
jgi:hypothetical protein